MRATASSSAPRPSTARSLNPRSSAPTVSTASRRLATSGRSASSSPSTSTASVTRRTCQRLSRPWRSKTRTTRPTSQRRERAPLRPSVRQVRVRRTLALQERKAMDTTKLLSILSDEQALALGDELVAQYKREEASAKAQLPSDPKAISNWQWRSVQEAHNKFERASAVYSLALELRALPGKRLDDARHHARYDFGEVSFEKETEEVFFMVNQPSKWKHKTTGEVVSSLSYRQRQEGIDQWDEVPEPAARRSDSTGQRVVWAGQHIGWIFKDRRSTKFDVKLVNDAPPSGYGVKGAGRQNAADSLRDQFVRQFELSLRQLIGAPADRINL